MAERPKFSLLGDVLAGTIMAGTSIPQLIAYAETVGYAGYRGLSTAGPNLLVWGLTTGSPWINCGVTSITAVMAKADLDGEGYVAAHGEEAYVDLVAAYSICVGVASFLLAMGGFGSLVRRVPKPLRSGFKWGSAVGVLLAALPNALLQKGASTLKSIILQNESLRTYLTSSATVLPAAGGSRTLSKALYVLTRPDLWSAIPCLLFLTCTLFVSRGKDILPRWCPPGTEVMICTVGATLFSVYTGYEGGVVGHVPSREDGAGGTDIMGWNVPIETISVGRFMDVDLVERFGGSYAGLAISSIIFAGVNFLSIVGVASSFESENNIPWSPTRELTAQGLANIAAGVTGSAPVGGSLSRSLVSRMMGATSSLSSVVTAGLWICFQNYMGLVSDTPKAALSAVIVAAVWKGVLYPKDMIAMGIGWDGAVAWGTGIGTVMTSPTVGFGIGVVLVVLVSGMKGVMVDKTEKKG
mmetsp:Transcript_57334/g.68522  ORF Transcript_57334/g.68522 Transcript_57334/m.68522 type:complete len:468 (+) Transcript_57334:154-1557(+)|eukprot:CAMPEP_0172505006 /NCGR_PEP_ID=MMETSP1066-20121228/182943_1 /TAXON_ID=671091 /ORGANISM="Coscinodiscus wailesii, Strain CCMP2513" /LENGTH=467 /DNA_ID=CAMNT_0013281439 /DNA_START=144 /DNA_END=1547 /DNA_ORIENTATION=+